MAKRARMYTIYDKLEERGDFDNNPANAQADQEVKAAAVADGKAIWPVPYPKMFYHPKGERYVLVAGKFEMTVMGPQELGKQTALVSKIANNEREAKALVADGWHDNPADSEAAAEGREAAGESEADLDSQIRALEAKRNSARARAIAGAKPAGARVVEDPADESLPSGAAA